MDSSVPTMLEVNELMVMVFILVKRVWLSSQVMVQENSYAELCDFTDQVGAIKSLLPCVHMCSRVKHLDVLLYNMQSKNMFCILITSHKPSPKPVFSLLLLMSPTMRPPSYWGLPMFAGPTVQAQ